MSSARPQLFLGDHLIDELDEITYSDPEDDVRHWGATTTLYRHGVTVRTTWWKSRYSEVKEHIEAGIVDDTTGERLWFKRYLGAVTVSDVSTYHDHLVQQVKHKAVAQGEEKP